MNFLQVHLHLLNPDVWRTCAPKNACLAGQQIPHPQINNDRAGEEKAAAKHGLQLHKTCDAAGQLSSDGSGRLQRAQVLQVCNALLHATAPPCTCTCAAPPRGRAGPSQGPLFRSAAHGGRESPRKSASLQTFFAAILALL